MMYDLDLVRQAAIQAGLQAEFDDGIDLLVISNEVGEFICEWCPNSGPGGAHGLDNMRVALEAAELIQDELNEMAAKDKTHRFTERTEQVSARPTRRWFTERDANGVHAVVMLRKHAIHKDAMALRDLVDSLYIELGLNKVTF
jgi:hypothetical protein